MDAKLEAEVILLHRQLEELGKAIEEDKAELIQRRKQVAEAIKFIEQVEERTIKEIGRSLADNLSKVEDLAREYIEKINGLASKK